MGMFGNFFGGGEKPQSNRRENLGGDAQAVPDNEGEDTYQTVASLRALLEGLQRAEQRDEERIRFIEEKLENAGGK